MPGTLFIVLVVLVVPVFFLTLFLVSNYHRLVAQRLRSQIAFSAIDVQLKRRYDLIPNLVETAKDFLQPERGALEALIAACNAASSASDRASQNPGNAAAMKELAASESVLTASLRRLFALAEADPDLRANQTMAGWREELTSAEHNAAFARQAYHDAVLSYNTTRATFPTNLMAGLLNFGPAEWFVLEGV